MNQMLKVENLTTGYVPGRKVLDQVSFDVKPGEILGIIGPNGSGKSTILKALTGVIHPWQGAILLKDKKIEQYTRREAARFLSFVSQENLTIFNYSALDIVLMGRFPHLKRFEMESEKDLRIAEEAMRETDTVDFKGRDINELSTGERQRVFIARALAQKPQVLVLDEPTSHLDIGHQTKIMDLLEELNHKQNLTIITVLHDLNLAAEYCQRLMLINEGQVIKLGTPSEVLDYELIEKIYQTTVVTKKNQSTGKPYVIPIGKRKKK